jgi:hypothetical protein
VAQEVEWLPSTCEALSSNPSATNKKKKCQAWKKSAYCLVGLLFIFKGAISTWSLFFMLTCEAEMSI